MKTLGDIQRDLIEAADYCFASDDEQAMRTAITDITTIMGDFEIALDLAWDSPNLDAAKPHLQTAFTLADVGTRLRKRQLDLFNIKDQVTKAATKLQGTDPETADTLTEVAQAIQHQINTMP